MTERFALGLPDAALLFAYIAGVLIIGWRASRGRGGSNEQFLAAGRSVTLPVFVATLVSTWYGGILGIGEFSFRYGLSTWVVFGLPYYLFAIIFALLLAPRIRRSAVLSIPDRFEQIYGRPSALAGGVLTFLLVNPAPYVLMLGLMQQMFFGGNLLVHLVLATLISGVFLWSGGLRADVLTNAFEFVMMYAGFAVMVIVAVVTFGGIGFLTSHVPDTHLTLLGLQKPQTVVVWFFIALWTLVDPSFHQRCAAARDERTARRGILVSVLFWFLFDAMTVTTGLYARALMPDLAQPALSYPALATHILPEGLRGLFLIALVATVMSTLTSMLMLGGMAGGRDVVARWRRITDDTVTRSYVRAGLAVTAAISIVLAWFLPSVVTLWYTVGTALIPGLLLPVLGSYVPSLRVSGRRALMVMVVGPVVSIALLVAGTMNATAGVPQYLLGVEPLLPGLGATALLWSLGMLRGRNQSEIDRSG